MLQPHHASASCPLTGTCDWSFFENGEIPNTNVRTVAAAAPWVAAGAAARAAGGRGPLPGRRLRLTSPAAVRLQILVGALVGGPAFTDDSGYTDKRTDYVTNEVSLDYNAGFTAALSGLLALGA